jgi:hypothetical protein
MSTSIKFDFDYAELREAAHAAKIYGPTMRGAAWRAMKKSARRVADDVKNRMPKDTWRATRSWAYDSKIGGNAENPFDPNDIIDERNYNQLYISQGTRVPYVEGLNQGHSSQAPAGFIEAAQMNADDYLSEAIEVEINKIVVTRLASMTGDESE